MQGQQSSDECDPNKTRIRGYRVDKHNRCGPIGNEKMVELVIDNATAADSGNYTCLLVDELEHEIEDVTVTLVVGRLPLFFSCQEWPILFPNRMHEALVYIGILITALETHPLSSSQDLLYISQYSRHFPMNQ